MEFLFENWSAIALAILSALGTITALTETEKDDTLVNVLTRIVQAIVFASHEVWDVRRSKLSCM